MFTSCTGTKMDVLHRMDDFTNNDIRRHNYILCMWTDTISMYVRQLTLLLLQRISQPTMLFPPTNGFVSVILNVRERIVRIPHTEHVLLGGKFCKFIMWHTFFYHNLSSSSSSTIIFLGYGVALWRDKLSGLSISTINKLKH